MFWSAGIGCDVRQVDLCFHHGREFDLGFLRSFAQTLQRLTILAQVDTLILLEFVCGPVGDLLIPVIATEMGIAIRGFHFDHAFAHFKDGYVKRTTAKVKDEDGFIFLFIEAVCQSGGCRLVDDAQNFETGNAACIFGGLALAVIEIRRDSDDCLSNRLSQIRFGIGL